LCKRSIREFNLIGEGFENFVCHFLRKGREARESDGSGRAAERPKGEGGAGANSATAAAKRRAARPNLITLII
jgi:hypothetical protein